MALPLHSTSLSSRTLALILLSTTAALGATALVADVPHTLTISAAAVPPKVAKAVSPPARPVVPAVAKTGPVLLTGTWQKSYDLTAGKVVEISVHLDKPSALPPNGRIAVEWTRQGEATPVEVKRLDIPGAPTSNWRKVLHALDSDTYVVYRAPITGRYTLTLHTVVDEAPLGAGIPRWREKGDAPQLAALPAQTPWPAGTVALVSVVVRPVVIGDQAEQDRLRTYVECKPDATPEQAQTINLTADDDTRAWEVTGSADDVEFFDNGRVGQSGDNWFRLEYKGTEPRLLTAQLSMPNQMVAARVRCYTLDPKQPSFGMGHAAWKFGEPLLPVVEYEEGFEENERVHQQDEKHRTNISRMLHPGNIYFLRVEANAPAYQLQIRVVKPAPYTDPRMAVRQGIYTQIGQVDAWITNRPRGASVERRLRNSGNLLGTECMSCHTQSGVWGPAVPFTLGYRPENIQNYWHLTNVMYECLRPTNTIKDAANNTSLAPLDFGDGPAGTRAAGYNIVNAEKFLAPTKLHAKAAVPHRQLYAGVERSGRHQCGRAGLKRRGGCRLPDDHRDFEDRLGEDRRPEVFPRLRSATASHSGSQAEIYGRCGEPHGYVRACCADEGSPCHGGEGGRAGEGGGTAGQDRCSGGREVCGSSEGAVGRGRGAHSRHSEPRWWLEFQSRHVAGCRQDVESRRLHLLSVPNRACHLCVDQRGAR